MDNKSLKLTYNENNLVIKANFLIEIKGKFSVLEQKIFAMLISEIKKSDEDFKKYKVEIDQIQELIGYSSNNLYKKIREISENLAGRTISIERFNSSGKKRIEVYSLLASSVYEQGSGYVEMSIHPSMKPYLIAIKGEETPYTKYILKNVLKLKNPYSIRLYELLKQFEKMRERSISLEDLKDFLGANLISYERLDNFEKYVLKVAKLEINENTDITIGYTKIKEGRRIGRIVFTILPKSIEKGEHGYNIIDLADKMGVSDEGFSDMQIINLFETGVLKTQDEIDVYMYVRFTYLFIKSKDSARNMYGYLLKAIENDYGKIAVQLKVMKK